MPLDYGLIQHADLILRDLPPSLQGLRIAHLTDLHVRRHRRRHDRLINQLTSLRLDLMVLTGDYITRNRGEVEAGKVLRRIVQAAQPRFGCFGVFGNHDAPELLDQVRDIGVHWLGTGGHRLPDAPIHLLGIDTLDDAGEDSIAMLLNNEPHQPGDLRLMLAHYPSWLSTAGDLGVHLMFAGHTHGGQIRLPNHMPLNNACDLPLNMSSGVLRHRNTLIAISRGLGEVGYFFNTYRAFCPPHLPVYTLRQGPTLGQPTTGVAKVVRW